ncbi:hypothetical protein A3Q56_03547 [Intoshia linei]|uniref:Uncharacterized protein n=1 Tax=Intoshia linei TaxID=1819745 RepID=A0A177B355_9BILA|nr:hypothetical protein A3Q56_03547 [Intoshia linei]
MTASDLKSQLLLGANISNDTINNHKTKSKKRWTFWKSCNKVTTSNFYTKMEKITMVSKSY